MNKEYSILLQCEERETKCKDLQDDFGFVCTDIKHGDMQVKEPPSTNWLDEDGLDVYMMPKLYQTDFELMVKVVYSGAPNTSHAKLSALTDYLTGQSAPLGEKGFMLYSAFYQRGYRGCYFQSLKDVEVTKAVNAECCEAELTFRVSAPTAKVTVGGSGESTYLYVDDEA